jgi:ABC-type nitrate/sulfonate/bicarbonate transport system substrate-binding protein
VRAAVRALRRGYREALLDPESAVTALVDANRGLDRARVQRQLEAVEPAFTSAPGGFGALDRGRLRAWARWAVRAGIVERPPDVDRVFDFSFAPG